MRKKYPEMLDVIKIKNKKKKQVTKLQKALLHEG